MNLNNQGVQVTAIIGIVVIVLALIGATVYAPSSGVNNLLTLIGGVVTVLLGIARLQSISTKVDTVAAKTEAIAQKVEVVHDAVNGLNKAALANQAIVSDAQGFSRGVSETKEAAAKP